MSMQIDPDDVQRASIEAEQSARQMSRYPQQEIRRRIDASRLDVAFGLFVAAGVIVGMILIVFFF